MYVHAYLYMITTRTHAHTSTHNHENIMFTLTTHRNTPKHTHEQQPTNTYYMRVCTHMCLPAYMYISMHVLRNAVMHVCVFVHMCV